MEAKQYEELGTGWQTDSTIECCTKNPSEPPTSCDCCYDSWTDELKKIKQDYSRVNEQATQLSDHYKFTAAERDKLKVWMDDLDKADQLSRALCDQFEVMASQTDKICTNSAKSVEAIEILFCMVRDLYEQVDLILTIYNQIDACIKCLNSDELPENSGIRKCLKMFMDKLDAVIKTRNDLIKAIMNAISIANVLHEGICSDYGLNAVITEWQGILNCGEKCGSSKPPADPCKDNQKNNDTSVADCTLIPILTLPICNDPYYAWVKTKYEADVQETNDLSVKLVAANKKKEALSACQTSLIAAIKEVNPKDLCK